MTGFDQRQFALMEDHLRRYDEGGIAKKELRPVFLHFLAPQERAASPFSFRDRAARITAEEARQLDPAKIRAARDFYRNIFRENPANAAAKARADLMDRILEPMGNP